MSDRSRPLDRVRALADQCVLCGACLPTCPTYALARRESMGPRGRIALLRAIADATQAWTPAARSDVQACLGCRRCERGCPALVRYGELIDTARATWLRPGWRTRLTLAWASRPALLRLALKLVRWCGLPRRVARGLGALAPPSVGHSQAPVRVLTGCSADTLEPRALQDFVALATLAGQPVAVDHSGCCGALLQHAGLPESAQRATTQLLRGLHTRTDRPSPALWLYWAEGCGELLQAAAPGQSIRSALSWWFMQVWPRLHWRCADPDSVVAIWVSCLDPDPRWLDTLRGLPQVRLLQLRGMGCCGAAGVRHLLGNAESIQLADALLDEAAASGCTQLVVTQPGCLHALRSRAVQRALPLRVTHLWTWLRALQPQGLSGSVAMEDA